MATSDSSKKSKSGKSGADPQANKSDPTKSGELVGSNKGDKVVDAKSTNPQSTNPQGEARDKRASSKAGAKSDKAKASTDGATGRKSSTKSKAAAGASATGAAATGAAASAGESRGKRSSKSKQTAEGRTKVSKRPKSVQPAAAAAASIPAQEEEEQGSYRFLVFNALPSWFVSMIVHAALIIMLAVFTLPGQEDRRFQVTATDPDQVEEIEEFQIDELQMVNDTVLDSFDTPESNDLPQEIEEMQDIPEMSDSIENPFDTIDFSSFADQTAPLDSMAQRMGSSLNNDLASRGNADRKRMVREGGGSDASEQAVMMALEWLAAHQREDGGWDFDHTRGPGGHRTSPNPGEAIRARNGATGLALLPFLGAGQTHLEGKYKDVVANGLRFLIRNQKPSAGAGSFHEPQGNMYSHGICAIALCEAYAMTNDRELLNPAQAALNFIVYAQDQVEGGWRYSPRVDSDTSVVGWQLMALKSGYMGYLQVPPNTIRNAEKFLDAASQDSGAYYGYTGPGKGRATTAVGLLSRMYLGWDKENPSLARGVEFLAGVGPSTTAKADMYYNYYATQVMRHYGGEEWETWNSQMRDWLISQQATNGNMKGSWYFDHNWSRRGGRLYNTAMGCMILEVYYRHLPIYREKAAEEEFPLD